MNMKSFSCLAHNILMSNIKELKLPYRMTFILTHRCQLRCKMCNIWTKTNNDELSLEEISRFFDKTNHFSWINVSGGEIFLRKDISKIFEIILTKCKKLCLLDFPTNGLLTDNIVPVVKDIILKAAQKPNVFITISLDGPPEIHNEIRGNPQAWDRAIDTYKNLRKLRSNRLKIYLGMTLQDSNVAKVDDTVRAVSRLVRNVSIEDFHFNVVHASSHYYANDDIEIPDAKNLWQQFSLITAKRKRKIFDPFSILEEKYQKYAHSFLNSGKSPIQCQALGASLFMDPGGNIYPCSIYDKKIGNIRDYNYDLKELWETQFRQETRRRIIKGNCPQCWTPCEAYQSILASFLPKILKGRTNA